MRTTIMHSNAGAIRDRQRPGMPTHGTLTLFLLLVLSLMLIIHDEAWAAPEPQPRDKDTIIAIIPDNGPPLFYRNKKTGEAAGFAVDVTNEVSRRAGFSVSYKFGANWDNIREGIQRGDADMGPGLSISADRQKYYSFSEPFDTFLISFFTRAGSGKAEMKPGATVGVLHGSVAYERLFRRPAMRLVLYDNFETGLFDLLAGKIDAFAGPTPVLWRLAMDAHVEDKIVVAGSPIAEIKRAFGVKKGRTELVARLNRGLEGFIGSPEYQKIYAKWYGKSRPFFTLTRQNVVTVIVLSLLVVAMTFWRHQSLLGATRRLRHEIEERKRVEEDLVKRERQLNESQKAAKIGSWSWDMVTSKLDWSEEAYRRFDKDPETFIPTVEYFVDRIHPDDKEAVQRSIQVTLENDEPYHIQPRTRNESGREWILEAFGIVERDVNGKPLMFSGTVQDITERRQAEDLILRSLKEKEVLLKEIHHRVKNNMQVISSLLNLQAKGFADTAVRAVFEEARNRVNSMALIHQKLYQSQDLAHINFNEYLKNLVAGIAETYKLRNVVLSVDNEPVAIDVNVGIPCGLIVNELVSNCLKHAFPDGRKGTITVGIKRSSEGNAVLSVADNGIGFPANVDFRSTSSLGLQLVNVLTAQIRGTIKLSQAEGTKFSITFPGS